MSNFQSIYNYVAAASLSGEVSYTTGSLKVAIVDKNGLSYSSVLNLNLPINSEFLLLDSFNNYAQYKYTTGTITSASGILTVPVLPISSLGTISNNTAVKIIVSTVNPAMDQYICPVAEVILSPPLTTTMATASTWYFLNISSAILNSNISRFTTPVWTLSGANNALKWLRPQANFFSATFTLSSSTPNAGDSYQFSFSFSTTSPPIPIDANSIFNYIYSGNNQINTLSFSKMITLNTNEEVSVIVRDITANNRTIVCTNANLIVNDSYALKEGS